MSAAEPLLRVRGLDAGYGPLQILFGIDLEVARGESLLVFGPNGAGKSTLAKALVGLLPPSAGEVRLRGESLRGLPAEEVVRRGVGYVPQLRNVFPSLTVEENLRMGMAVAPRRAPRRIRQLSERYPLLHERRRERAGNLSGGQRQIVAMARALMPEPELLVLDEPSAGLAPALVQETFEEVRRIADSGTSVLMVEQNAKQALMYVRRGLVLDGGRVRFRGPADALLRDHDVADLYLGVRRG